MGSIKLPLNNLKINLPSLFLYSDEDTIISHKHSQKIYNAYKGIKNLIPLKGDHNEVRSDETLELIMKFSAE